MLPAALRSLLRTTPTVAPVPHRALISITGPQASEFLSGIVAATPPPSPDCHFYTAFLHAQGRVLYDAFLHSYTSPEGKKGYLLEYDARPSEAPPLLTMLKRYVLRSKVRLRDVSEEYDIWSAWGSDAEKSWEKVRDWTSSRSGAVEPAWNSHEGSSWPWGTQPGILQDRRAVGIGARLVVRKGDRPGQSSTHDIASAQDYLLHRILHGVPEGCSDIIPMHSFPMDSNLDLMGALDFRKGCYLGQELTVRTYHTGTVRKRIFPVHIHRAAASPLTIPADNHFPINTDIRTIKASHPAEGVSKVRLRGTGKLLSSINDVGLALLRLEHVESVEKGDAALELETQPVGDQPGVKWSLTPWRPEWWPNFPSNDE